MTLTVRFCRLCQMYHDEKTRHLTKKQLKESKEYDVYHANGTIYFSQEAVEED